MPTTKPPPARRPKSKNISRKIGFIEPMECLSVGELPRGPGWTYEIKLDGFRLEAVKDGGETILYSRRGNILNEKFGYIADALVKLPNSTILDGEIIALDGLRKSSFTLLQNFRSAEAKIHYYAFDILMLKGKSLLRLPLDERRKILEEVLPRNDHVALSAVDRGSGSHILKFVKKHRLEGVVAKRSDSNYEPGKRTGLWSKYRINAGQEFVVGGYTPGTHGFDALIVGFYEGRDLLFAARVRAGFVPATRREIFGQIKHLKISKCPFADLPQNDAGRWGAGITADKMKEYVWLEPRMVARIDFAEWTDASHLRHTKFVAIRDDKDPRKVVRDKS